MDALEPGVENREGSNVTGPFNDILLMHVNSAGRTAAQFCVLSISSFVILHAENDPGATRGSPDTCC